MLTRYKKTMNKLIQSYLYKDKAFLNDCTEKQLGDLVRLANQGYYNNDKPIMTDLQYDKLKFFIEDKFPHSEINKIVPHTTITITKNKVQLPYEMWSMDKIVKEQKVIKKLKNINQDQMISAKLDGISLMMTTEKGDMKLYTRGNGKYGQDVSHLAPYLKIPHIPYASVRGELLIKKETFAKKYSKKFANARNFVSGVVNAKNVNINMINDLDFVAYELIEPERTPFEQFSFLEKWKLNVVRHVKLHKKYKQLYEKYLQLKGIQNVYTDWRANYEYEIDGLILCNNIIVPRISGNPKHAWAFKMILDEQIATSVVEEMIWSPSKDGHLKPKIRIKPVKLCGAKITYVTVHNEEWRRKNGIDVGAEIQIIRSGDVIPKVHSVIKAVKVKKPPAHFKVKMKGVDYVLENPDDNFTVKMKSIHAFFVQIGTIGLGRGNVKRIMESGYDNVQDILNMKFEDFMEVEGFKDKLSKKLVESIKQSIKTVELPELMIATNIFGRGLGVKKIRLIMESYPNILIKRETYSTKVEKIAQINGFQVKTAKKFVDHIANFIKFINVNGLQSKVTTKKNKKKYNMAHPLYGKKIVITGFRDKNLEFYLKNNGINVSSSVTKNTDIVVYNNMSTSGKIKKAKELNIQLIQLNDFKSLYIK
jgi:DNA ligase (NAD+)